MQFSEKVFEKAEKEYDYMFVRRTNRMINLTKQFFLIIISTGIIAVLNFFINSNRPILELQNDEMTFEMLSNIDKNIIFLDTRNSEKFNKKHITNALNLSEESFNSQIEKFLDMWNHNHIVVVYCDSLSCNSSRKIAERLKSDYEIKDVFILKDDWQKWER